jgi:hypothetical protein
MGYGDNMATGGSTGVDYAKQVEQLRTKDQSRMPQGEPAAAAAPSKINPADAAKLNEDKVGAARAAGVASPAAAAKTAAPPMPTARPDVPAAGVPDIKIDPRHPLSEGSGMKGRYDDHNATKAMQTRLQDLGYSVGRQVADGKFGPNTTQGVKDFQKANGLPETGKVDKATWDKMRSDKAVKHGENGDGVAGTMLDPGQTPHFYETWDRIKKDMDQRKKLGN